MVPLVSWISDTKTAKSTSEPEISENKSKPVSAHWSTQVNTMPKTAHGPEHQPQSQSRATSSAKTSESLT